VRRFGIFSVAGSSSHGGLRAVSVLLAKLRQGSVIAMTPDGPRGPIYKVKSGVIKIAQRSGAPIYPVAIGAERKWVFGSWDRMILPKPFARTVIVMGEPYHVPSKLSEDEFNRCTVELEERLNQVTARADTFFSKESW
jgi:lysophospholipid acyltransferase (LPLAT)-like uncharacterized protein